MFFSFLANRGREVLSQNSDFSVFKSISKRRVIATKVHQGGPLYYSKFLKKGMGWAGHAHVTDTRQVLWAKTAAGGRVLFWSLNHIMTMKGNNFTC
jgi:hypothetical protein